MPIRIPEGYHGAFISLLELSEENLANFFEELSQAGPSLHVSEIAARVASASGLNLAKVKDMVRMLVSLCGAREGLGDLDVAPFVDEVVTALEETGNDDLKPGDENWEQVKQHLCEALGSCKALRVTSRARELLAEHEHNFVEARVLTDLRPVFQADSVGEPDAMLLIHSLRITYGERTVPKEFFVALSSKDIRELRRTLDRAIEKEERLKAFVDDRVPFLEE